MRQIVLIAHNLRSTHNVGSLLRTAEGLSVQRVYLTGYTPYPKHSHDVRLPHIAQKIDQQIHKTALDAESIVQWRQSDDIFSVLEQLRSDGFLLCALEQTPKSMKLPEFSVSDKIALVVGREVEGIEAAVLTALDCSVEIPMLGRKESFNVVQAAAMALYHCRFALDPTNMV